MLAYLRSDEFSWNPHYLYHNEVINQACHLAEMLIEGGNTDELLQSISGEFKIWHDGWNYQIGQGFKIFNKQLYVLHVGIAVAYIYFNSGQPEAAQNVFEIYFRLTMQQYRNTVINNYGQHYLLAIRFLIHVLLRFNPDRMEMIVTDIVNQIDDIEDLLIIASGIADTAQLLQVPINTANLQLINTRIDREYWIIESQLKLANHLSKIGEYKRLKENYTAYAATQNCI